MDDHDEDAGGAEDDLVDPTAVIGRRVAGWFVDVALVGAAALIALVLLGDSFERPGSDIGLEVRQFGSDTAIFFRSTVAVIHTWEWVVAGLVALAAALVLVVALPGRRGWSPGLLAADLRLVDGDGERAGIRRALIRFVGWVVDVLPGVPLVGFAAMRHGRHHQRVGDRLARTYVVDASFAGRRPTELAWDDSRPTVLPDTSATEQTDVRGGVAHDEATVHRRRFWQRRVRPERPEQPAEPDTDTSDRRPSSPVESAAAWAPDEHATAVEPAHDTRPDEPRPPEPGPPEEATEAVGPPEGVVADEPLWDRRRERYVMWHGRAGRWVHYDDEEGRWKPL